LDDHLAWLTAEIETIEAAMAVRLHALAAIREHAALLISVPGIGMLTAASVLALLPELGRLDGKAVASLAGVAPFARDSGVMRGRRTIWGGRKPVRAVLYMATLVATRHNRIIRAFYDRLRAGGKAKKLAITACMRTSPATSPPAGKADRQCPLMSFAATTWAALVNTWPRQWWRAIALSD
jgi:transposase